MTMQPKPSVKITLLIFFSFLLTSTGHLSWMYHLMEQTTVDVSYQISTAAGYALQAAGIAVFALFIKQKKFSPRAVFIASISAYAVCLIPSVLGTSLAGTVVFGLILSLLCGMVAGYYLYELTADSAGNFRAVSFGIGYGMSTIASWVLSLIGGGALYYGNGVLIICIVLTALSILTVFIKTQPQISEAEQAPEAQSKLTLKKLLLLAGGAVILFSLVNNIGFSFSASEVKGGLRPEFSRLFYAVGLIAAGFVTDKSRKYGAVCALAALVIPFIELALRGELISSVVFWALGYFAFGFYSVYRIILFSDIAKTRNILWLSGFGLLIGRAGDSLGSEVSFAFSANETLLVVLAAMLFVGAVFLFIKLFQFLYVTVERKKTESEVFEDFALNHDLSAREREVLQLLLQNKTNKEISESICVSENTVKFHVRNLLQKTGCKSRVELRAAYHSH